MQNIKEANMFWFGRACVSGTLWCLEIQKTFISKAGWAVALPWRNIWIDGIRPSTVRTLKAVWFSYRLIEFASFIFFRHSYFSIFFEEHHFPFWQEEVRKFQRLAKLCPHSIPTKPRLLWNNKWKLRLITEQPLCFRLELMCMRSSLLLLLEGMAHFLPSPERQYCYSQLKFSDVYVGRHQHQAIENICNLEDGASTCSDSFGPPGPLHLYHTLLHFLQLLCRILLG